MAEIITVFGATGYQGGALVRALLSEGDRFKVRGVTRNLESDKAKQLAQLGVEMVQGTYDDVNSLEQAMEGTYGVFAVTHFEEMLDVEGIKSQGRNLVDAAKKVGVKYFVYSGQQSASSTPFGRPVPVMEGKAFVEEYMFNSGIRSTSVRFSFYFENIFEIWKPNKVVEGEYIWNIPIEGKPFAAVSVESAGKTIVKLFKDPAEYAGKVVLLIGDFKTMPEYWEIINQYIAPRKLTMGTMTAAEFVKLDFPAAHDIGVMFEFMQCLEVDPNETRRIDPEIEDFQTFVKGNQQRINDIFQ